MNKINNYLCKYFAITSLYLLLTISQASAQTSASQPSSQIEVNGKDQKDRPQEEKISDTTKMTMDLAASGNKEAQYILGVMYLDGNEFNKDDEKAVRWWSHAANNNHKPAYQKLLELASAKGNSDAQNSLGVMYKYGYQVEQNYQSSFEWFAKSAKQKNPTGQYNLALMYEAGYSDNNEKDQNKLYSKALELYRLAAASGSAEAMNNIGVYYTNGYSIEENKEEAFKWYERSAAKKYYLAEYNLGNVYYRGAGVEQDYFKAFNWYKKSADQGFSNAMFSLATLYSKGLGVRVNDKEAFNWYEKAATLNNQEAQFNLGVIYANGNSVTSRDDVKSVYWYEKAAKSGHTLAQYNLGFMYVNGRPGPADLAKAAYWYGEAAKAGHIDSQFNLGLVHAIGSNNFPRSYPRAYAIWSVVAKSGSSNAIKNKTVVTSMMSKQELEEANSLIPEYHRLFSN